MGAEATAEASVAEARAAEVAAAASVLRVSESLRSAARSKVNSMTEELLASARQFAAAEEALAVAQDAAIKGALTAVGAKAAARTIAAGDLKGGEPEDLGAGRAAGREGANGPGRATDRADDHSINLLQLESALQEAPSPPKTVEELGNDLQEAEFRYDDALEVCAMRPAAPGLHRSTAPCTPPSFAGASSRAPRTRLVDAERAHGCCVVQAHRHALKVFQWWSTKARDAFNAQGAALRAELQSVRDFCGRFEEAVWGAGEAREDAEEALNAAEWSVTDAREQVQDTLKAIGDLTKADAEADGEGGEEAGPRAAARTAHAPVSRKAGGGKEGESPEEEEEAEGAAEPKTIEGLEADLRLAEANVQIAEAALVRANTDVKEADQAAEVAAALKKQASEKLAAALDSQVCATRRHERDLADEWYDVVLDLQVWPRELRACRPSTSTWLASGASTLPASCRLVPRCQAVSEEQRDAENGYMEAARALEAAKAADDAERSGPDESAVSKNIVLEARLRGATVVKMKADMVVRRAKEAADSTACLRGLCEKAARAAEQSKNQHMPPVERVWKPGEEVERLIAQEAARDAAEHALLRARAALSEAAEASDAAVCEWAQAYESVQEALEAGKTGDEPFQVDAAEEGGRLEAGNEDSAGQEEEKQSGDKAAARKEEEAVDSDDEEAPAVTQPRTLNEALEAAAIKVKTAEHRAAMLARKLRLQELAAVLAAKKEAEAAEAKFTSAEKTYSDCRKALTKEDRASKQARRALRAAAKAVDDAEGALEAIKDNPDGALRPRKAFRPAVLVPTVARPPRQS